MAGSELNGAVQYHLANTLGWPSLRPLQEAAIEPVRSGADCLLVGPTAGGKTEAAIMPVLSEMAEGHWRGLSVLYVTPLRALLNNLHPRLSAYAAWTGRTVGLWHGDTPPTQRARMLREPPDILLTTPESLESMLVSTRVDHRQLLGSVRCVIIDELHAFAGDDRGWHLLGVLERIQHLCGWHIQRIGLSATVGNPDEIGCWLQGGSSEQKPRVVAADVAAADSPEITVDYVGSVSNAATVLSRLHRGQKRLVFCEARAKAEELAHELRARDVQVFVSHSSLSREERRRSEEAFAEARDCVIVATSTLELGIDVGDLDVVAQLDAPGRVASFLQRLGRTGRRAGSRRNTLFLATDDDALLRTAGLLLLWSRGYVEPVIPPPSPRHLVVQQLLALTLQEGQISPRDWREWFGALSMMVDGDALLEYLRTNGFLETDGGLSFIGPDAERHFGRRHFMELLASFTAPPEMRVVAGRNEIGRISPLALSSDTRERGSRALPLAGRLWRVESVRWDQHEVLVSPDPDATPSKLRWSGDPIALSYELCRAQRDVLLGADPPVTLSRRAGERLGVARERMSHTAADGALVLEHDGPSSTWWTWAGQRANATVVAALGEPDIAYDNACIRATSGLTVAAIGSAADRVSEVLPPVSKEAIDGLKFSVALPPELARATLAERLADRRQAGQVLTERLSIRGA